MTEIIFAVPPFSAVSGEMIIKVLNSFASLEENAELSSPSFAP